MLKVIASNARRQESGWLGRKVFILDTTKDKPERARALKNQGLTVAGIVNAMAVSKRTIFQYLSQK